MAEHQDSSQRQSWHGNESNETYDYFVDNLVDDNINGDCDNEEGGQSTKADYITNTKKLFFLRQVRKN